MPSGRYEEEKNLLALPGIEQRSLGHPNVQYEIQICMISGFRRDVNEVCALLRYYTA
jgi:hypothetical protein